MTQSTHTPSTQAISPLGQRMIEDITMRKLKPSTQKGYLRSVKRLADFLERSPHTAKAEELGSFKLHLVNQGASSITINALISGLRFFFHVTINNPTYFDRGVRFINPAKCLSCGARQKSNNSGVGSES